MSARARERQGPAEGIRFSPSTVRAATPAGDGDAGVWHVRRPSLGTVASDSPQDRCGSFIDVIPLPMADSAPS